jgi:hypothetical protein
MNIAAVVKSAMASFAIGKVLCVKRLTNLYQLLFLFP